VYETRPSESRTALCSFGTLASFTTYNCLESDRVLPLIKFYLSGLSVCAMPLSLPPPRVIDSLPIFHEFVQRT